MKIKAIVFTLLTFSVSNIWCKIANLNGINFKQVGAYSRLVLEFDKEGVEAKKFHITDDKQIIIDVKNVQSTARVMRAFDTSEFSGSVVFVSAYKKPGTTSDIRIALQLRDNVRSILKTGGTQIFVDIENRFGVFDQKLLNQEGQDNQYTGEKDHASKINIPKSQNIEDILENLTLSGRKKYIGKRVSLNVRDVAVHDLLKMMAEASGFNIIVTEDIKKLRPLSLNLNNTPWDQILDTILSLNKLVAKKNGTILMVQTLAEATRDKEAEQEAKKLVEIQEPLVTRIFPISYAQTTDLIKILKEYLTKNRGKITEDTRTNALIIKDTPEIIEKMKKIVELLDKQTPQVLIQSKIVEVNEAYAKEIGLRNGLKVGYDPIGDPVRARSVVGDAAVTPGTDAGPGFVFSSAPANSGDNIRNLFSFTVARFRRLVDLDFTLQLMESESKGKIISSPKVITQNKKQAKLKSTKSNSFRKIEGSGEDQVVSFEEVEAKLELQVTPQITNEGSIILEIELKKEDFGDRPFANGPPRRTGNEIKTNVLVDNGSTIVLGGLYEYTKLESHSGVPFLKDVPLVGWLFRTPYAPETSKREIIIFITPRVINQEEAGLIDNT